MPDATDDIGALGLPKKLEQTLRDFGLASVGDVTGWTTREVLSIPGVGVASVALVKRALDDAGLFLTSDPNEAYVCARHDARAWDARLVSFILCGGCLTEFTSAFRESPPLFNEVFFGGYCQNCNLVFDALHTAQWNLCGNCERVSRSIGRSIAAERFVVQEFERDMEGSGLTLEQIDQPVLRPHDALVLAQKTASIDFMLRRDGETIAGFELKTGRNHLGGWAPVGAKINQFQLDHGDCDDIIEFMRDEGILVYLMHAQVIDRASPPTTRFEATGLWWIDPYSFSDSYQSSRTRPRETKMAAYYRVDGFKPISEFREHVLSGGLDGLRQRLLDDGPPDLYQTNQPAGADP